MEAGVLNSPPERRQVPVNAREDPSPPVQHHCWEHPIRQHRAVRRPPKRRVSPAGEQLSPANRSGAGRLIPGLSFSCRDALSPPHPPPPVGPAGTAPAPCCWGLQRCGCWPRFTAKHKAGFVAAVAARPRAAGSAQGCVPPHGSAARPISGSPPRGQRSPRSPQHYERCISSHRPGAHGAKPRPGRIRPALKGRG